MLSRYRITCDLVMSGKFEVGLLKYYTEERDLAVWYTLYTWIQRRIETSKEEEIESMKEAVSKSMRGLTVEYLGKIERLETIELQVLAHHLEIVGVLCKDEEIKEVVKNYVRETCIPGEGFEFHRVPIEIRNAVYLTLKKDLQ